MQNHLDSVKILLLREKQLLMNPTQAFASLYVCIYVCLFNDLGTIWGPTDKFLFMQIHLD